ncbi:hypothetical protein [Xylanimonas sp. McL0601]|uniref:hypothetical protein n=1 Tax=Xylanimonas sp. McL0601 TaxID=3414739 RepID=UPI003CF5D9D3
MSNRTYPRIGAAVLAGLVAVVPVVGAVAVAQPAAASQSSVVFEHGTEVEPIVADGPVSPDIQPLPADITPVKTPIKADISEEIEPISEEITPIKAEVGTGFPWFFAGYMVVTAAITGGAVLFIRRRGLLQR